MVRRAVKATSSGRRVEKSKPTKQEILSIKETLEELATARCPLCRMLLIARMGRRGPGFYCRCRALKKAA